MNVRSYSTPIFVASDNTRFFDKTEAEEHNRKIVSLEALRSLKDSCLSFANELELSEALARAGYEIRKTA